MTQTFENTATITDGLAGKYLTVLLGGECYAIPVARVREILRFMTLTRVPQMPAHVAGVVNLRGRIIAVIDLRVRFGLKAEPGDRTCIVVVRIPLPSGRTVDLGLVVDSVEEVVTVGVSDIEPTPEIGTHVDTEYLLGMAHVKARVSMLLDITKVIAGETLQAAASPA